jgi:hypothetical protein
VAAGLSEVGARRLLRDLLALAPASRNAARARMLAEAAIAAQQAPAVLDGRLSFGAAVRALRGVA